MQDFQQGAGARIGGHPAPGFAGALGDSGVARSAVELAKEWRTDRALRQLEAMMIVADAQTGLVISGNGDVVEPESDIAAIGSGGPFALADARALSDFDLSAEEMVRRSLTIAGEICVYTNTNLTIETLKSAKA